MPHSTQHNISQHTTTYHNMSQQHTSLKRRPTKKHFSLCPIITSFHGGVVFRVKNIKEQDADVHTAYNVVAEMQSIFAFEPESEAWTVII